MMLLMVKDADLDRIDVPEDYEVLDATAVGRRLGFKRDTVLAYLSRRNFRRIPRPNRQLAMGPIWYEESVREWEARREDQARGRGGNGERPTAPHNDGSLNGMDAVNVPGEVEARKARRWREGGYAVRESPYLSFHFPLEEQEPRLVPCGLTGIRSRDSNELLPPLRVLPTDH